MYDRRCPPRLVLALCGLLAFCATAAAGNWPRFRGPDGTGVAADKDVPVRWTEKDGVLWKAPIPGKGHSSPIVWGKRVFLQSAAADGSSRSLLCLDADSGKVLWSKEAPGHKARTHNLNTLASSTPATDGEHVFAVFWDGTQIELCAYDFKGNEVWKRKLGRFRSQHGPGLSPVVHAGRVFLNNDQDGFAVVEAFETGTGKTIWRALRKAYRTCYSTPFIHKKPGGETELIVASTSAVTSYDPVAGGVNWSYTWDNFKRMPLRTVASPIFADGLFVINSGDGAGDRHAIAVRPGKNGDKEATLAWEDLKSFPYVPTLLAKGDHIYAVTDDGFADCFVARTGALVWHERLGSKIAASPILVDGKVYAVGMDGTVYVFRAATPFKLLAKNRLGEPVSSTPAAADGRLYIRGEEHLFCIGKPADRRSAKGSE